MSVAALKLVDQVDEPERIRVDVGLAAALIHTWSAVQTEQLVAQIRRSGALQRYVRGSRK